MRPRRLAALLLLWTRGAAPILIDYGASGPATARLFVYDDADGFKHVAYGRAAPVLAAALAALAAKHDGLERRVARLEALLVGK